MQVLGQGICYLTGGTPETASHTVICLHGAGGSAAQWREQLALWGSDVYAVAVDLPGHGKSEGQGARQVEEYAHWLSFFLEALSISQRFVLAGICLGTSIALEFARQHQHRVAGLILAGLTCAETVSDQKLLGAARGYDLKEHVESLFSSSTPSALRHQEVRRWLETRPEVRYCDLLALKSYEVGTAMQMVVVPRLITTGVSERSSRLSAAMLGLASEDSFVEIEEAGVLSIMEAPRQFSQVASEFLLTLRPEKPPEELLTPLGGYRRMTYR